MPNLVFFFKNFMRKHIGNSEHTKRVFVRLTLLRSLFIDTDLISSIVLRENTSFYKY